LPFLALGVLGIRKERRGGKRKKKKKGEEGEELPFDAPLSKGGEKEERGREEKERGQR